MAQRPVIQPTDEALRERISRDAVEQYEWVRSGGQINMFDRVNVHWLALKLDYGALADVAGRKGEYAYLLTHYGDLMRVHGLAVEDQRIHDERLHDTGEA